MKALVWVLILLCAPAVFAQEGSIKLLALSEKSDGSTEGIVADLDLEVVDGSGRVFLETFPLTKITTQVSMRFAQQVACKELDIDCAYRDFFFTVKALPGVVGGPSAGSAAAVLAAALIADLRLRNDTVITGTINSGGVIGPVGGLKEKIEAAAAAGMHRALIPKGTAISSENETNATLDLVAHGKKLGVEVIEVSTLLEALEHYTGKSFPGVDGELIIENRYTAIMQDISRDLCNRTAQIHALLEQKRTGANTTELEQQAANFSQRAAEVAAEGQHYAAASFCFRSNVFEKRALALQRNWTERLIASALLELRGKLVNVSDAMDKKPVDTISDVQTYMAVKERLFEADDSLLEILGKMNETQENAERLAYAEERLFSAVTWARFFNGNDKKFAVDPPALRNSCIAKISEAEERINYVRSFLPASLGDARRELDKAYADLSSHNYTLCLYKASKTKAEADVILGLVGVPESRMGELITLKQEIVKDALIKSQRKGIFPIIGYSYYEYANSLTGIDRYSSLLFLEYALEFSNLDIYFTKKQHNSVNVWRALEQHTGWLITGVVLGLFIALVVDLLQQSWNPPQRGFRKLYK